MNMSLTTKDPYIGPSAHKTSVTRKLHSIPYRPCRLCVVVFCFLFFSSVSVCACVRACVRACVCVCVFFFICAPVYTIVNVSLGNGVFGSSSR